MKQNKANVDAKQLVTGNRKTQKTTKKYETNE